MSKWPEAFPGDGGNAMQQQFKNIQLDKSVPIPLYYQLKTQLLALIESGALKPGDLLPPENDLCELLQISRPTVRQAMSDLVEEGYLMRFKGKGTFIGQPKVKDRFLSKLQSFNIEMREKGMVPRTEVLALEIIPGNPTCNDRLCLPFDEQLIRLKRIRYGDDVKMVYVETYLSYKKYALLMNADFATHSLYESLEAIYGVRVNRANREIEAVTLHKKEAELLNIPVNKAVCLVTTVAYADNPDKPVEYSIARYRGDRTKFSVETYR